MKLLKLCKDYEQEWMEAIKNNKCEFIFKLYNFIISNYSVDDKILMSNDLITELLLDKILIETGNNEFYSYKYKFVSDDYIKNVVFELCQYIDFRNFKYSNLILNQVALDIMSSNQIVLDLNRIFDKNIDGLEFDDCIIEGTFDGFSIKGTTIKNCETEKGYKIMINPQKIKDRCFSACHIENVIFTENFDNCDIRGLELEENDNVVINPQKVKYKNLSNCKISDATFMGSLDNCNIDNMILCNCNNAYVNAEHLMFHHFKNDLQFQDINIIISNEKGFNKLKSYLDHLTYQSFYGASITCDYSFRIKLFCLQDSNSLFAYVDFNIPKSDLDDLFERTFNLNKLKETKDINVKKKSHFLGLRRR